MQFTPGRPWPQISYLILIFAFFVSMFCIGCVILAHSVLHFDTIKNLLCISVQLHHINSREILLSQRNIKWKRVSFTLNDWTRIHSWLAKTSPWKIWSCFTWDKGEYILWLRLWEQVIIKLLRPWLKLPPIAFRQEFSDLLLFLGPPSYFGASFLLWDLLIPGHPFFK